MSMSHSLKIQPLWVDLGRHVVLPQWLLSVVRAYMRWRSGVVNPVFCFRSATRPIRCTQFAHIYLSPSLTIHPPPGVFALAGRFAAENPVFGGEHPLGIVDYLGIALFIFGFGMEITADIQKFKFAAVRGKDGNNMWIDSGVWGIR